MTVIIKNMVFILKDTLVRLKQFILDVLYFIFKIA